MDVMRVGAFQESGVSDSQKNNDVGVGLCSAGEQLSDIKITCVEVQRGEANA